MKRIGSLTRVKKASSASQPDSNKVTSTTTRDQSSASTNGPTSPRMGAVSSPIASPTPKASPMAKAKKPKSPADPNNNARMQERMEFWIDDSIVKGKLPCAEVIVSHQGKIVCDYKNSGIHNEQAGAGNTIYRLYSMTKPVIATLLFTLFEEGKLQLDLPVHKWLGPKWKKENMKVIDLELSRQTGKPMTMPCLVDITLHHLLTHTSGLSHGLSSPPHVVDQIYAKSGIGAGDTILLAPDKQGLSSLQDFIDKLVECPLMFQPGEGWEYSYSFEVLGRVIELITRGKTLETIAHERLFFKLGMKDTSFFLTKEQQSRLCPFYFTNGEGKMSVQNTHFPRYVAGGVGLYSTKQDYFTFASMLLRGGLGLNNQRILSPKTVEWMMLPHLHDPRNETMTITIRELSQGRKNDRVIPEGFGMGYGAAVALAEGLGELQATKGEFAWAGATSTHFFVDPTNQIVCVFMSSMLEPKLAEPVAHTLHSIVYKTLC